MKNYFYLLALVAMAYAAGAVNGDSVGRTIIALILLGISSWYFFKEFMQQDE